MDRYRLSPKYQIFQADPFFLLTHDPNNPNNLCFSKFSGHKFSVLNLETKCRKDISFSPVDERDSPIIFHSEGCHDQNYTKTNLENNKMYAETMNIFHGQSDQIKDMIELQKFDNKIHREMVEKFKNVKQEFERMEHAIQVKQNHVCFAFTIPE